MPAGGFLVVTVLCVLLGYAFFKKRRNAFSRVPGPKELPLIGSALAIDWPSFHLQMAEWAKMYGPVFKFSVLGRNFVVLSSKQVALEALVNRGTDFAGRPRMYRHNRVTRGNSIVFNSWTVQTIEKRKIVQQMVAVHGSVFGRLEDILTDQMSQLLTRLEQKRGESIDVRRETGPFVLNSICILLYGEGYSYDDPHFDELMKLLDTTLELLSVASDGNELDIFPWLRFTGLYSESLKRLQLVEALQNAIFVRKIDEAKASLDRNNPRGVVDQLLIKMLEQSDGSTFKWNEEQIFAIIQEILAAGILSTVRSLQTAFLIFIKHPDIQLKVQEEVDRVVGELRPSIAQRPYMPYTEAFVMELLRYTSIMPMHIPHSTMADTSVAGYDIPSNCTVLINAWAIHHNENVYKHPFEFIPTRFLDSHGKPLSSNHLIKSNFFAFGAGKRSCPAENFGFTRIFFMIASIMQRFTFVEDESRPAPDPDARMYELDILLRPPDYHARAISRQ